MSDQKSPFPAGFERDGKTLMLMVDQKLISRSEFRRIVGAAFGLEQWFDADAESALPAPQLVRPTLQDEYVPEFAPIDGEEYLVYETTTGGVYDVRTGEQVGWVELEGELLIAEDEQEILTVEAPAVEALADEPVGPPPVDLDFIDPEGESDEVALPRPNPDEDEQIDDQVTPE